jgi:hypothetical protein
VPFASCYPISTSTKERQQRRPEDAITLRREKKLPIATGAATLVKVLRRIA